MLLIIDASNLIIRVLRTEQINLMNSQGLRTGGIHGFLKSIHKLCRESRYEYFPVVCWDEGVIKFRQSIYSGYKDHKNAENRDVKVYSTKEEEEEDKIFLHTLFWTKLMLHTSILPLLGIPTVMVPGVEADDIVAFSAMNLRDKGLIVSNDADLFQLITDDIKVYKPVTDTTYDKAKFIEKYDLLPEHYRDHFVLMKSMVGGEDGIPHVHKGLGEKGASKIASKWILNEPMNPKIKNEVAILEKAEEVRRNQKLMDLHYFQANATEEVYQIKQRLTQSLVGRQVNEFNAYAKFDSLEMPDVKELVSDLCESGGSSRERLYKLAMRDYK